MGIARYLSKLASGLSSEGVLSAAKGGTGTTTGGGTTISAISYPGDDTAADPAGGQTITLTGTNFASGAKVLINQTQAGVVSVVSSTQITFTTPALSAGSYILYVVNTNGSTAIAVPGLQVSGVPAWSTAAGSLGAIYESTAISTTVSATSNSAVSYSVVSGNLPANTTIASNGTITGTSPLLSSPTTYTFTIRATDAENQDTDRTFSLTINPDVVTWSSSNTISLSQDTLSSTTLLATSASGQTISYATNTLPTGLTLSGNVVSGTPTVSGTTTTTATATAAVTGKSAQQTITWTISVASDTYWKYTTLLLNAETAVAPFVTDASTNNSAITVVGDTKPSKFSPYTPGYYSNYFDGTGDSLAVTGDGSVINFGTGDFTIETWVYVSSLASAFIIMDTCPGGVVSPTNRIYLDIATDGSVRYITYQGATVLITSGAGGAKVAQWTHVALVKSSSQTKLYVNGTQVGSTYADTLNYPAQLNRPMLSANGYDGVSYSSTGYLSNLRIVKGTAVYTANFTPPTTPLTAVTNTSLLTCQSNRFVDLSTNAYTMTKTGDVAVTAFSPFAPNATYADYGSAYFDGTGDWLQVANSPSISNLNGSNFTVECWAYATSTASNTCLMACTSNPTATGFAIFILSGNLTVYANTGGTVIGSVAFPINAWNHVAFVRNSTSCTLYLNGISIASATVDLTNPANTQPLVIGGITTTTGWNSNLYLTGYIADARIVKGTAVYTANFTPPTTPLTAVTNTQLLTCQTAQPSSNSQFIDNSTLTGVVSRFGNTTQGTFSPYGANWSTYFPATASYLSGSNANFNISATTSVWTLEGWFYPTQLTGVNFFSIGSGGTYVNSLTLAHSSSSDLKFRVYQSNGSGQPVNLGTTNTYPLNNWYHVAVTRTSAGVITIYVNGVADGTVTYNAGTLATGTTFVINGVYDNNGLGNSGGTFYGSNIRFVSGSTVYTANFTPSTAPLTPVSGTVLLACQGPSYLDNGPYRLAITRAGSTSTQKFSPFLTITQTPQTYSAYFGSSGDYLSVNYASNSNIAGDFTWETWAYDFGTNPYASLLGWRNAATGWSGFVIQRNNGANNLTASINVSGITITQTCGTYLKNQWNHIALVRSGTTVTLYVNGTSAGTATLSGAFNPGTQYYIGTDPYNDVTNVRFVGYISNQRFVNGTAVYTANFTPPTAPLTAVTNTGLLACQSSTLVDNSSNAFAITVSAGAKPLTYNPFGVTVSSAQAYTASTFGGSMYFDNSGDYLAYPTLNTYLIGSGNFTIECWVYKTSSTFDTILSYSSGSGLRIFVNSTGGLELWNGATSQWGVGGVVPNSCWNHIAFVRNGTLVTGYVNGVNVGTATISTDYNAGTLNIGGEGTGSPWGGYIADFRITKGQALYTNNFVPPIAPLTAGTNTTVLLNGERAAIADKAGKVDLETVGDARVRYETPYAGSNYSNYFDGTGDYLNTSVSTASDFGTGDFTVEFWMNASAAGTYVCVVGTQAVAGNTTAGMWRISNRLNSANGIYFNYSTGSAFTDITFSTTNYNDNVWHHVAACRTSNSLKMYVDGVSVGTATTVSQNLTSGKNLLVGYQAQDAVYYTGYVSNLRIIKGTALYTANFTPPTTPLTAITNTSLLTCQSKSFVDNSTNAFTITRNGDTAVRSLNPFQTVNGSSMYFDGTGDYLAIAQNEGLNFNTGQFTIEMWVYPLATVSSAGLFSSQSSGADARLSMQYYSTTGIGLARASAWVAYTSVVPTVGAWSHIAITRDSAGAVRVFINGTAQTLNGGAGTTITDANGFLLTPMRVGEWGGTVFNGYIDDLRVTKGYARYTANFTPPSSALLIK